MITEIPSGQIDTATADAVTYAMPDGLPRATGYYPNLPGGYIPKPIAWGDIGDVGYGEVATGVLDWTETIDQHPVLNVSATWTPAPNYERPDGHHDPLTDGPPQPTLGDITVYYSRSQGASATEMQDVPGRTFPANGSQDGVSWTYFQDTKLAMLPYDQTLVDPKTGEMPDTLRGMPPSPVHGWVQQPANTGLAAEPFFEQQVAGRQELLATNPFAGQSYSAHTAHVPNQPGEVPTMRSRV